VKRSGFTPASPAQKAKVEAQGHRVPFVVDRQQAYDTRIDPAHTVSRALGGCDHEDCVIGLTRSQHRAYDEGRLSVLEYLTLDEQAHAVSHLGILGALRQTTGDRYVPEKRL
jgi:hypothetical protein